MGKLLAFDPGSIAWIIEKKADAIHGRGQHRQIDRG